MSIAVEHERFMLSATRKRSHSLSAATDTNKSRNEIFVPSGGQL